MASTLPDVQIVANVWTEVYSVTGITTNTPLIIQNKISTGMTIQVRSTTPVTISDGYSLASGGTVYLDGVLPGVWVRCPTAGRVLVMDNSASDA